ncbi:MAG: hypothetical protein WEB57_06870 [Pseudohongiellaceae bacterium]
MNTPTPINDEARQRYLREMGIAVYYPRYALPGAGASRRYHTDIDTDTGADLTAEKAMADHEPESRVAPASLGGLKDSLSAGSPPAIPAPPAPSSPVTAEQTPAAGVDADESLEFRFTWFRPDERLCVLAGHDTPGLSAPSRQMLERILAALSPRYQGVTLQGEPFHWPLDAAMPGDIDTARQVVRAFLRRRAGDNSPPFMLLLMDEPPDWLLPAESGDVADRMLELMDVPGSSQQLLRVPALETMARDASAKRPAWKAMQSLIQPLAQCDRE